MRALALVLCGILICGCTGSLNGGNTANQDVFAKCLTVKGVKMYGASWCPVCQEQKDAFGDSWKYVKYVECANSDGTKAQVCIDAGIGEYPTWEFGNGSRKTGGLYLEQLSAITGCELNRS
jgi:hypothetical protein